jgi:hypothetical protein
MQAKEVPYETFPTGHVFGLIKLPVVGYPPLCGGGVIRTIPVY